MQNADPKLVASHLVELLAAGEAVPCKFGCLNDGDFFMLRGRILEPSFNINDGVSCVPTVLGLQSSPVHVQVCCCQKALF